ncbi:MAG: hypothetical protein ISS47_08310 [Candidatus Omnitrophica bacterium]|nr:hypothetical protein [Candidatus Omnitrophota bacterium]
MAEREKETHLESSLQIKLCSKQDIPCLVNFLKRPSQKDEIPLKSKEDVNWLYKDKVGSYANLLIVKYSGKVIGMAGYRPFKLVNQKQEFQGAWGVDIIVHSSYRKIFPCLFSQLYYSLYPNFLKNKISFLLTAPQHKNIDQCFKKIGWRRFTYFYEFRAKTDIKDNPLSGPLEIKIINSFDKKINHFLKQVSFQYDFFIKKNADYLNWRYLFCPRHKYTIMLALKRKEILGYVVLEEKKDLGCIVEILGNLDAPKTICFLFINSLRFFKDRGIKTAFCLLTNKRYIEIARRMGFYPYKREEILSYCIENQLKQQFLAGGKNCHFNLGDGGFL